MFPGKRSDDQTIMSERLKPRILIVTPAGAETEIDISGWRGFSLKPRAGSTAPFQIAFETGEIAAGNYISIVEGQAFSPPAKTAINHGEKMFVNGPAEPLEIIYWRNV